MRKALQAEQGKADMERKVSVTNCLLDRLQFAVPFKLRAGNKRERVSRKLVAMREIRGLSSPL